MWNLFVITVLAAIGSVYTNFGGHAASTMALNKARDMAENMAVYREAVVQYYTINDIKDKSVTLAAMKAAKVVPTWSTLYTTSTDPIWSNYRAADGTIYVYALKLPNMDIQTELAYLSRNSYLVGTYKKSGNTLYSPVFGNTGISLAALSSKAVPDNAPVWIGYRR